MLLDEVPGVDHYDTERAPLLAMIRLLVRLQVDWLGRVEELLACGLPDWRLESLVQPAADVVARIAPELDPCGRGSLAATILFAALPRLSAEIEACGITSTLVHGDFHPANLRGTQDRLVLLDWGDCGVGHPLLDQAAFLDRVPEEEAVARPGRVVASLARSDPRQRPRWGAALLLEPVAALRQALIYRGFLDAIEPDERIYHAADPAIWLVRAAECADKLDWSE